jgi:hypothetical protein
MNSAQDTLAGGLPHSEIPGSPIARISPGLFAACHVLHRLSVPRHPPDALLFALDHRRSRRRKRHTTAAHRTKPPLSRPRGPTPVDPISPSARLPAPRARRNLVAPRAASHEDTSPDTPMPALASPDRQSSASPTGRAAGRACPPRSHHNSLFTRQSATPPRSPASGFRLCRTHAPWPAKPCFAGGGGERIRTDDLLLAKQALSQLSYTPAPAPRAVRPGVGGPGRI